MLSAGQTEDSMDDVSAWEQIRSRFLDGASEYPGLFAYWGATEELWTFGNSLPEEPDHPANPEAERLFKEVATAAIRLMGRTGNAEPPWHVWLDIMRKGKQGFRRLYAQTRTWKEFQTAMEVSVDAAKLPLTDNGTIASVFERSADFCEQLSYEAEIPSAETDPGEWLAASEAEASRIVKENAQRLQKQIDDAISLFETLPSFAPVQVRMRERMNEAKRALSGESKAYGRQARRPHVLLLLDIRAEEFLEFVTDIRTQNAYMAWLPSLESAALEDYTGAPPGILQPSSGDQLDFVDEISERLGHWRLEGYKRVASRVKASPNSVDQRASEGESPRSQFTSLMESSSRFRVKYLKALATLLDKLNESWEKVLPPNAQQPTGSAEEFFGPFAQFAVALYNAYARERLDSRPSLHLYQEALNFELKTLVCSLIAPYRETPIQSLQDALRADEQGEFPGEWSLRMGESWRNFDHPRHDELERSVRRIFLDENLLDWERLQNCVHKAISKRVVFWLAEHAELAESNGSKSGHDKVASGADDTVALEHHLASGCSSDEEPRHPDEEKSRGESKTDEPRFPDRAAWLNERLRERSWNKHDPARYGGPDHKTVQKILDGARVREDVLKKLMDALSKAPLSSKLPTLTLLNIPPR